MYRAVYPHALGLRGSKYGGVRRGYTVVSVSKLFAVVALAVLSFGLKRVNLFASFTISNFGTEGGSHHAHDLFDFAAPGPHPRWVMSLYLG